MLTLHRIDQKSSWKAVPLRSADVECLRSAAATAATGSSAGLVVVCIGGSGTVRSLAAAALAQEAGLALYRVDPGRTTSKYIGETEKNLDALFSRAASARSVLLFDEADALFGQRTGTTDASDRYANIETDHLLARIEAHPGIVILASNTRDGVVDTIARRASCVVLLSA